MTFSKAAQFSGLEAQLAKAVYTTTGTAPTLLVSIPNITALSQLLNKKITVKIHQAIAFGANATLNVNGLGAINISNYNVANTSFRSSTLEGYIFTLIYNGTVFTMADFGATNPVDGGQINQTIGGVKTFASQIGVTAANGLGLTNTAAYIYTKQGNNTGDVVGDVRVQTDANGYIISQQCTVANATKGAGTWVTKFNSATYLKGASAIANATAPNTVSVTANTKVALSTTSVWTLATGNTTASITDVNTVVQSLAGGLITPTRAVFKELAPVTQANGFSIGLELKPNFGGNASATLVFELWSNSTNTVIRNFVLTLSSTLPTGVTAVPHTLQFFPIADASSFTAGYEVRVICDKAFTYALKKVVRNTIGQ